MIDVSIVQDHVNEVVERYTAAEKVDECPDRRVSVYEHKWN